MKTDVIKINSVGDGMEEALVEAEKFAAYRGLPEKESLRVRILTEESLCLVRSFTQRLDGDFWIKGDQDNICRIVIELQTVLNKGLMGEFLSLSTARRNAYGNTILSRIRDVVENCLLHMNEVGQINRQYMGFPATQISLGAVNPGSRSYVWSLNQYRSSIERMRQEHEEAAEVWEEMSESILATMADEVRISVAKNAVRVEIEKAF